VMVQCFRETAESPIMTWLAESRPTDSGSSVIGRTVPSNGPDLATNLGCSKSASCGTV